MKHAVRIALVTSFMLVAAAPAAAHVEREPVFVDPAADTAIFPAAGGGYVTQRPLGDPAKRAKSFRAYVRKAWRGGISASERRGLLDRYTRLSAAQQRASLRLVSRMRRARAAGPSPARLGLDDPKLQAEETLVVCRPDSLVRLAASLTQQRASKKARKRTMDLNRRFKRMCRFAEIQPAVQAAGNHDTVVVMPGFYTEPTSRAKPHNDPACAELVDAAGSPSFAYHVKCPNDLSLVALIGRDLKGACVRCNVQIVGSGSRPQDVIIEGAKDAKDPGVAEDLFEDGKGQVETAKEVGVRVERADGAVLANLTVRNTSEHGVYSIETDGMLFRDLKLFYSHEYGHLSFVTDHNVIEFVEAAGSSDAGIYPGASPPTRPRLNTIIRNSYSHHNAIGVSGTMGSNLHMHDNVFAHNSTGITLDSLTRAGHPGFPQNSSRIERNLLHSNNFDTFSDKAWVKSSVPAPIGAGIIFAGGNDNLVAENHIYDNWKWGTALISVPDALSTGSPGPSDARASTSHRNRYERNVMGIAPEGAELPNGLDFWWDELGQANCWQTNRGPGENGAYRSDPSSVPDCDDFPNFGTGNPAKEAMLVACFLGERSPDTPTCDWYRVPPKPGPE